MTGCSCDPSLTLLGGGDKGSVHGALRVGLFSTAVTEVGSPADCRRGRQEADSSCLKNWGAGGQERGQRAGDRAGKTEQAEAMEGDEMPWGSEPVSGPGPGGGGMIRELCRGFGRYRRYLGRLRQNLRETQKFFRDIKGSHNHSCPSSPTEGGGAERGPTGDVAEIGLQAGKESSREGDGNGEAKWRVGRPLPLQNNSGRGGKWKKRRKVEEGPRGRAPGPGREGSEMPWEGILRGGGGEGRQGLSQRRGAPEGRSSRSRIWGTRLCAGRSAENPSLERAEVKPRTGESCCELGDEHSWSESHFRDGRMEG